MRPPGWLIRSRADVPAGDAWLSPRERAVQARLRVARRRDDWRLGRFAAKAAVAAWLGVPSERVEVLAASDGAPEAWVDGARAPLSLSLSHRAGRALAAVAGPGGAVGCDLEVIEPRSSAFVRSWLAPAEQALVARHRGVGRARAANLVWTAKEAAAKVRREGLRLDVRAAVASVNGVATPHDGWRALRVDWTTTGAVTTGWWRSEPGWVMTIACEPPSGPPRLLAVAE
jgi:4'-phosphopantetheinyl transferase